MPNKKSSKRITFRANEHDQRTLKQLIEEYVGQTTSQIMRDALREMLRRCKRRQK